ncbi:MAG: phosphatase PAP2 family protein [Caldimonas sp.]
MTAPPPPAAWSVDIALRMRRYLALKIIGVSAVTGLFFIGYLHLLHHPAYPVTVMPATALDHLIPFSPQALFVYLSLWLYVGVGPGLQASLLELFVYGLWIAAMCVCGLAIFYFWPTEVPPLPHDIAAFPGFAMLQAVDAAGNACPSLHVAAATFTVVRVAELLRRAAAPAWLQVINAAWFVAIVYSTLAIKQHVALDAVAGALLGVAFALPSLRWRPAARRRTQRADVPTAATVV